MLIVRLHPSVPSDSLLDAWHVDPLLAMLLGMAVLAYGLAYRAGRATGRAMPPRWQVWAYGAGLASLAVALMGPPDHFSGTSFAAHMVQHLILTLIAAPLIVLGRPVQVLLRGLGARRSGALLRPTIGRPGVRRALAILAHPISVVLLFNGSLLIWHVPWLYEAAVRSRLVHDLEHAAFFGTALLFWWVLVDPVPPHHRLTPTAALLVLFATWMIGDLLGAALTLAREPLYPLYAATPNPWGLSAQADQRLGGLLMWAGAGVLFAVVMIGILAHPRARGHRPRRRSPGHGPLPGYRGSGL